MPERRTGIILDTRAETGDTYTTAYITEDSAASRISATYGDDPRFYYRRLQESEIDITSKGLASAHFGKTGTLSLRGGPMTQTFDVENLEVDANSPTFVYRTFGNAVGSVSNEVRFGLSKRFSSDSDPSPRWVQVQDQEGTSIFAKEYIRNIGSQSSASPMLIDHREGNVILDDGTEETSPITGKTLRSHTRYGTVNSEEASLEVDTEGNMAMFIPDRASHGLDLTIVNSDLRISVGKDELHSVERNSVLESGSRMELESPEIDLGRNAEMPAVRGTDLKNWVRNAVVQTAMGPANFSVVTQENIVDAFSTKVYVE